MDTTDLKRRLPTFFGYWERRQHAAKNQLPKHLRAPSKAPVFIQMALNLGIIITLGYLIINQDDFVTEAGPAIGMVVCLLLLIYTLIEALELKSRYQKMKGLRRLAQVNFGLMIIAFLTFAGSVIAFLP